MKPFAPSFEFLSRQNGLLSIVEETLPPGVLPLIRERRLGGYGTSRLGMKTSSIPRPDGAVSTMELCSRAVTIAMDIRERLAGRCGVSKQGLSVLWDCMSFCCQTLVARPPQAWSKKARHEFYPPSTGLPPDPSVHKSPPPLMSTSPANRLVQLL